MLKAKFSSCIKDPYKIRLEDDVSQDFLSSVKYSQLWRGFKGFTTTMGLNPHINQAVGEKCILWKQFHLYYL